MRTIFDDFEITVQINNRHLGIWIPLPPDFTCSKTSSARFHLQIKCLKNKISNGYFEACQHSEMAKPEQFQCKYSNIQYYNS